MKFSISQDTFSEVLQKHIPVLPVRTTLPILNSMKLDIQDSRMNLHSTDLEITLITNTEVVSEGTGSATVPARKLSEIVRELPSEMIEVEIDDNHQFTVNCSTGVYKISGSDAEDFPAVPESGGGKNITMNGEQFKTLVNRTVFAVSKDDMRPTLCGIYLHVLPGEVRTVSTDGHRLSKMVDTSFETDEEKTFEVIVPVKSLNLAVKTIADDDEINIAVSGNYLMIDLGDEQLYSRLIEGKYPLYENVIPKTNQNMLIAPTEALNAATRRVSIFSNSLTRQVKFQLSENSLMISAEDADTGGSAEEHLEVDYDGEEMEIGFNSNYIVEALRHIGSEDVKFSIGTPDSACIITPTEKQEDQNFLMLLMPVRLP